MTRRFNIVEGVICLSVEAIAQAILEIGKKKISDPVKYIWVALHRSRKEGDSWKHFADKNDARKKWIVYESLPTNTRTKVELYYKDVKAICYAEMLIEKMQQRVQQEDISFFLNRCVTKKNTPFSAEQATQLAEGCAWLRLLMDEEGMSFFKGKLAYYENIAKVISQRNLYGLKVKNGRVLQRKVKAFSKSGKESLVHKSFGNANRQKLCEMGLKRLIALYSSPLKPTYVAVTEVYNREAKENGWCTLSVERVRQLLTLSFNRQMIFSFRHGEEGYRNSFERTIKRRKPSFPDALWSMDGHTIQLRYMDKYGKVKSDLYAISIMDIYSDRVVGYSIGKTENSTLVQAALRNACRTTGMMPYQLQYDNSSANKSGEVTDLLPRLSRLHFPCQPYNGKSKPIENLIGRLEGGNFRYFPNFKGGNITSPNIERKANPDFLMSQTKNKFLPDLEAVIAQFKLAIEVHNNTKGKDGKTPLERYQKPHKERKEMDYLIMVEAFWVERKKRVRYTKDGLTIEVNKERYTYEVESERGIESIDFRRQYLGERFTIKYDPDDLQHINLYIDGAYIETATRKWEAPMAKVDYEEGDGKRIRKALEAKKAERELNRIELEDIRSSVRDAGFEELSHELLHKDAYNRMEQEKLDDLLEQGARFTEPVKRRRKKKTLYESGDATMEKLDF